MKLLSYLSEFMIPFLIFYIVASGVAAKKNVYEDFLKGAGDGLVLVWKIMPTMIALMVSVNVLRASGFLEFVSEILKPAAEFLNFPAPLLPLTLVKAFSGSAATGLLLDLFKEYGVDSLVGRIGAMILSSNETIFYTMSLYFMSVKIRKTRYTLAGCILSTISGTIASVLFSYF